MPECAAESPCGNLVKTGCSNSLSRPVRNQRCRKRSARSADDHVASSGGAFGGRMAYPWTLLSAVRTRPVGLSRAFELGFWETGQHPSADCPDFDLGMGPRHGFPDPSCSHRMLRMSTLFATVWIRREPGGCCRRCCAPCRHVHNAGDLPADVGCTDRLRYFRVGGGDSRVTNGRVRVSSSRCPSGEGCFIV